MSDYTFFTDRRHQTLIPPPKPLPHPDWRIREKIKTVSVSLVLCLNIGVDPPDLIKTKPCAKMECWIDPFHLPGQKALEAIGRNLQMQYEAWQPRARYRLSLDPSIEETKKLCCSLRRNAKDERILFHYNGHGVPKPTVGGEIWVFNRNYTQYIPVSIYDIQTWLGAPCIFVYDCSNAGHILNAFNKFASQRDAEATGENYTPLSQCIQLAACRYDEVLPLSPDLPADLFTSCLTTPIMIALRWFVISNPLIKNVTLEMAMKVPGRVTDRRTPLGELNWIFTSITDTIAWSVLPTPLFLRLFRNDLMVAALFRNFLLADRIIRNFNCHPVSFPVLPVTHQHPMWEAWDLAADHCLSQLPGLLEGKEYKLSSFFADQLSAFEVWIKKGGSAMDPPQQLPIVLQVLLSQVHRLRALLLLSKFLDFGRWAVNLALSVGIFPYVLKLLQSPSMELRPVLVFIWAKLLAVDESCKSDLLKDNGYTYFIEILTSPSNAFVVPNISEHRAMCVFILSVFVHDYPAGKEAFYQSDGLKAILPFLEDEDSLLRQWTLICLSNLFDGYEEGRLTGLIYLDRILVLLKDSVSEVRASCVLCLSRLQSVSSLDDGIVVGYVDALVDGSPIVRRELCYAFSTLLKPVKPDFYTTEGTCSSQGDSNSMKDSIVWKGLLILTSDASPSVSSLAISIIESYIEEEGVSSPRPILNRAVNSLQTVTGIFGMSLDSNTNTTTNSMKRSSSFVHSLKSLVGFNSLQMQQPHIESVEVEVERLDVEMRSVLYEWSCEYFRSSQMRVLEIDDPGSYRHTQREYLKDRNRRIDREIPTQFKAEFECATPLQQSTSSPESVMKWFKYENRILTSNLNLITRVEEGEVRGVWDNGCAVRSLEEVNGDLVLVGGEDGSIKVYSFNSPDTTSPTLLTGWFASRNVNHKTTIKATHTTNRLTTTWHQQNGLLFTAGNEPLVKVWDVDEELCVQAFEVPDIVTTMSVNEDGNLLLVGQLSGGIGVFDRRVGLVGSYKLDDETILTGFTPSQTNSEFTTASRDGSILIFDMRNTQPLLKIETIQGRMKGVKVSPLGIACWLETGEVQVMKLDGRFIGSLKMQGKVKGLVWGRNGLCVSTNDALHVYK